MAGTINIDYGVLNEQANAIGGAIDKLIMEMEDIHSASEMMHADWEGSSKSASQEACTSLLLYLHDTIDNLSTIRNTLMAANTNFQVKEEELSKIFQEVQPTHSEGE